MRGSRVPRLIHSLVAVALLLLVLSLAAPPVTAAVVEAQGTVTGPGVDGTIVLRFDTDGGGVEGSATINIQRSCKNGQKLEIRSMTIHQGRISNGQLVATAVFDGSDWPYGFGRVCRGAD